MISRSAVSISSFSVCPVPPFIILRSVFIHPPYSNTKASYHEAEQSAVATLDKGIAVRAYPSGILLLILSALRAEYYRF
jgi:hypothetical protein